MWASALTGHKFVLMAAARATDMNVVYHLPMAAHLQLFAGGTVWGCGGGESMFFCNLVKWNSHLFQHPLNSKENTTNKKLSSPWIATITPLLSLEDENSEFTHVLFA